MNDSYTNDGSEQQGPRGRGPGGPGWGGGGLWDALDQLREGFEKTLAWIDSQRSAHVRETGSAAAD